MAFNMVQSLSSQLGLRVKQPSVKPVREQFHISSEITLPLTILASRLEPLVPSGALGWSVDQRSLWSKSLATQRMLRGGFILRLLMEPEAKWITPLDMCATMMAPCVLLFTIHQSLFLAIDVLYWFWLSLWLTCWRAIYRTHTISLSASGSVLVTEAFVATPNRYCGYIELVDPLINVHDRFN